MDEMRMMELGPGWYGRLEGPQRRTFWATFGGNALDNLDFSVFSFLIPTLVGTWGMTRGEAGLIATSTAFTGALGGIFAGAVADRFGRVAVLQLTILWFALFTFACGFAQSPAQLLALRAIQGLGFGGELAVGAVLIGEAVAPRDRGRIMGGVASGYAIGSMGASALYAAVFALLPADQAWRWCLWLGILPALLVLYVRRGVHDPEPYHRSRDEGRRGRWLDLFAGDLAFRTPLVVLLVAGATGAQLIFAVWLPTWLRTERGLSVGGTGVYAFLNAVGALIGFLVGGQIIDCIGRRNSFRLFAATSLAGVALYLLAPLPAPALMAIGLLTGVSLVIMGVGMTPYLTELFPTAVRASGLGLGYSAGRAIGALSLGVVGWLSDRMDLGATIALAMTACLATLAGIATLLPETAQASLDD